MINIDINTFIASALPEDWRDDEVIGYCSGTFRCEPYSHNLVKQFDGTDTYVVVSTLDGERRVNGKGRKLVDLSRRRENCRRAFLFVLDDIGTKSKAPLIEPSYKLRTSYKDGQSNEQWGYFLDPFDVSTANGASYYEAACRAAGMLGISDPGMAGIYRLCRVPGSLHRSGYRAEIIDWNPDRDFALPELVDLLGLDIDAHRQEIRSAPGLSQRMAEDPVLDWLGQKDMVGGEVTGDWFEITCPWAGTHTTGDSSAGYSPLNFARLGRQFKCFHSHCADKDTATFLAWVAKEGGPKAMAMEPISVNAEARALLGKLLSPELDSDVVQDLKTTYSREQLLAEYMYSGSRGEWFRHGINPDGSSCVVYRSHKAYNVEFASIMPRNKKGKPTTNPVAWWSEQPDRIVVDSVEWDPSAPVGISVDGTRKIYNSYVPYTADAVVDPDVSAAFDDHVKGLFGADAIYLLQWMGWLVQHPEQRINWAPVLLGPEGCGKSLIGAALSAAIGRHHVTEIGPTAFMDSFNTFAQGFILVICEELRVSGENRFAVLDRLKPILTNDQIDIREMRQARRTVKNCSSYMIMTNHHDAIPMDDDSRRWAVFSSVFFNKDMLRKAGRLDPGYYANLFNMIRDNPAAIRGWLLSIDVTGFNPKGHAPETEGSREMRETTKDEAYALVYDELMEGSYPECTPDAFSNTAVRMAAEVALRRSVRAEKITSETKWQNYLRSKGWAPLIGSHRVGKTPGRLWYREASFSQKPDAGTVVALLRNEQKIDDIPKVDFGNVISLLKKGD